MPGTTDRLIQLVAEHWFTLIVVAVAIWLLRNRYHNGLNKYPGPFMASLTDWWRFVDVWNRRPELTHISLHERHGDVVRLGPNTLSFADPAALKAIYGLNKGYVKVSTHTQLYNRPSSVTDIKTNHKASTPSSPTSTWFSSLS